MLAVLGATLAGLANLAVAWKTGRDQLELAQNKNAEEKSIEETKAESARILEIVKASDPDRAAQNLAFLLDSGLITSQNLKDRIAAYLEKRKGGQGVSVQAGTASVVQASLEPADGKPASSETETSPPPLIAKEPSDKGVIFTFSTGWIGGGHSQAEACSQATASWKSQNSGKTSKVIHSSEENRKDLFGHVTYNYTCVVGPS